MERTPPKHRAKEMTPQDFEVEELRKQQELRPVQLQLGGTAFDTLTACSLIDESTLAAQVRIAIHQYNQRRLEDPELPTQLETARAKHMPITETLDNEEQ